MKPATYGAVIDANDSATVGPLHELGVIQAGSPHAQWLRQRSPLP